jgi:hypothetical protein
MLSQPYDDKSRPLGDAVLGAKSLVRGASAVKWRARSVDIWIKTQSLGQRSQDVVFGDMFELLQWSDPVQKSIKGQWEGLTVG